MSYIGTVLLCVRDFVGILLHYYTRLEWLNAKFAAAKSDVVRVEFPGLPRAYATRSPAVVEFALKSEFTTFDKVGGARQRAAPWR